MEFLQNWLDSSDVPLLTALLLGLLTAVSPCPLATNITAIGFIGRGIAAGSVFLRGLLYALGRMVAYTVLGALLIYMIRQGVDTFDLQMEVSRWGEWLLPPLLVLMGLWMLVGDRLPLGRWGVLGSDRLERLSGAGGSFLLGILFALAFCPTSGLFYFGMLIPMSASATGGYALPMVYALATGLPVVLVAWLLSYGAAGIAGFYRRMQVLQRWLNLFVAILFIAVGLYYAYTYYFQAI